MTNVPESSEVRAEKMVNGLEAAGFVKKLPTPPGESQRYQIIKIDGLEDWITEGETDD
jgi:hypothetical protein